MPTVKALLHPRHTPLFLAVLFALALFLRLVYVFAVVGDDGFGQGVEYYPYAEHFADGHGYWQEVAPGNRFYARRPPGLPLLLAALRVATGDAYKWAGRFVYCLLSAATVLTTYLLGRTAFNRPVALLAAALMAVNPEAVYYCIQLNPAIMQMFFTSLILLYSVRLARHGRALDAVCAGFWLGCSLLTRPHHSFYWVLLFVTLWLTGRAFLPALRRTAIVLGIVALVLLPWIVRNYGIYHTFMPGTSIFWREFFVANHPSILTDPRGFNMDLVPKEYDTLSERELEARMRTQSMAIVREQPEVFVRLAFDRFIRLWRFYPHLEFVDLKYALIMLLSYGLLFPFMLLGLGAAARTRWRLHSLFYLLLAYYSLICSIVVSYTRYRLTLESLLLCAAAAGLLKARQLLRTRFAAARA